MKIVMSLMKNFIMKFGEEVDDEKEYDDTEFDE